MQKLKSIVTPIIHSPANTVGLIVLLFVNFAQPPVDNNLIKLGRVYIYIVILLLAVVPYIITATNNNFCFSKFLSRPLTIRQIIVLGVVLFVFSLLAPMSWVIAGREAVKVNITHFIMNFIGAIITFFAILLLNKLPINTIKTEKYNFLFLTETTIISAALYVQFNYESRTTFTLILVS